MRYATALASSPLRATLGPLRHDGPVDRENVLRSSMSRLRSPAVRTPATPLFASKPPRCRAFGDHHDAAHRSALIEHGQILDEHDLVDPDDEVPAERSAGVQPREVLAFESPSLQQGNRQASPITSATVVLVVGARSCGHASSFTQPSSARPRFARAPTIRRPSDGNDLGTFANKGSDEPAADLVRSPLFESRIATSSFADNAQIAVHAFHRVQERGGRAR